MTPIRIAILIDGGFFIKRYNYLYNKGKTKTPEEVVDHLYTLAHSHCGKKNHLYRIFYYDCLPFGKRVHNPVSKKCIVFENTPEAVFRKKFFDLLKQKRKVALRLGYLKDMGDWKIKSHKTKQLLNREITIDDLTADDVIYELRQKSIDMKIGVDIASLSLKRFVDRIVLISGDADFVPAAKLARRKGIDFILNPMKAHVDNSLFEHIDGLESPVIYTKKKTNSDQAK
ncbi:MAG: NYN domain-containing protein [Tannerella sp.]|jgi:uncharacterized LabA/DUF88 family protein|nr:NYN domain-containing protein [Tannerella sp.]